VVVDLVAQQPAHLRLHRRERARQQVDVAQGAGLLADGACGAGPVGPDVGDEEADQHAEDEPERGHQARAERTSPASCPRRLAAQSTTRTSTTDRYIAAKIVSVRSGSGACANQQATSVPRLVGDVAGR